MHRTRIKICGICRPQDALAAASAGADAIGMVFHPDSPRCIGIDDARQILAALPPFVAAIGLFVDADAQAITHITEQLRLCAIQLHGSESPQLVAQLKPTPVIKALRLGDDAEQTLAQWRAAITDMHLSNLRAILLETPAEVPGGSGVPNDWNVLHRLQQSGSFNGLPALIAAGGLTAQSVGEVVRLLRPFAVDVSTGVESARREKSPQKILDFIRAVCAADAGG